MNPLLAAWRGLATRMRTLSRYSAFELARPVYSPYDAETFLREGYRKNPVAYRCVELLAASASAAEMRAVSVTRSGEAEETALLPHGDPLAALVARPSSELGTQRRFIRHLVRYLGTTGEAPLYLVRGKRTGRVVDIQILPPWLIGVKRGPSGVTGYEYRAGSERVPIAAADMRLIKLDDPLNPDRGLAPLHAIAREIDTDNALCDYRMTFFQNAGVVAGLLTTEQRLTAPQRKEFADEWRENYAGRKKAGKTPVLSGGLTYQPMGGSPKDFDLGDTAGIGEARICLALGTPPVLIGAKVGLDRSTFSNYEQAYEAYGTLTVLPLMDFIAEELTAALGDQAAGREVRFDLSRCAFAQESANARHRRALDALKAGALTINGYLSAIGEPAAESGDVYLRPAGMVATPAGSPEPSAAGKPPPEGDAGTVAQPAPEGARSVRSEPAGFDAEGPGGHTATDEVLAAERRLIRRLRAILGEQAEAVFERLKEIEGVDQLIAASNAEFFDAAIEAARVEEACAPLLVTVHQAAGKAAAVSVGIAFDAASDAVVAFAREAPMRFAQSMTATTQEIIRTAILDGVLAGSPAAKVAEDVTAAVADPARAEMIARTETMRAANAGATESYLQAGIERVRWITAPAGQCEYCEALDGTEWDTGTALFAPGDAIIGAKTGAAFTVSGYGPVPYPPLHPRCRCAVAPA